MGSCLSKKDPCSKSVNSYPKTQQTDPKNATKIAQLSNVTTQVNIHQKKKNPVEIEEKKLEEEKDVVAEEKKKKEVIVIEHRKSNDKRGPDSETVSVSNVSDPENIGRNLMAAVASGQGVRTSSCTKEEVDAILIQCGRLSRSSSGNGHVRRYSGSKRSFDFDKENEIDANGNEGEAEEEDERVRRRESRGSNRRRRTPSRSRERVGGEQTRSTSSRRVSRSPGRRSESPMSNHVNVNNSASSGNGNGSGRPGKLVSVPPTVTSLSVDKSNNGNGGGDSGNVKRVLVRRNVGSPRSQSPAKGIQVHGNGRSSSPARGNQVNVNGNGNGNGKSHSPARGNQVNVNGNGGSQQQGSLSRNGSRKAEQSPYRRTPLNEIDLNSLPFQPLVNKKPLSKAKEFEEDVYHPVVNSLSQSGAGVQGTHRRTRSRGAEGYEVTRTNYCRVSELHTKNPEQMTDEKVEQLSASEYDAMVTPIIVSGTETLKLPQTLMRSRSARRSRELDINVDALLTPPPATNYTTLLLQDIQNFHQKKNPNSHTGGSATTNNNTITSNNNAGTPFSLHPCVSKACSIVEAVADLNSISGSNVSLPFTEDRRVSPRQASDMASRNDTNFSFYQSTTRVDAKDPFIESKVGDGDDLMEPSLHKYVTVRKRVGDMEDEESSGSNSIVGGIHQNWVSSSSWEPNSADSDCWTSKSYTQDGFSPVAFQRHAISDFANGTDEDAGRKISKNGKELQSSQPQATASRARTGSGRGPIQSSKAAAASM